jgi:hypothetical protein
MRQQSFWEALIGDGRPALATTGAALVFSGGFALFLTAVRQFLPHDIAYLGLSAADLCALDGCRVVDFMFHDRASFGGALIAIGALYLWLVEFPLREREAWAWWALAASGVVGFFSFLAYLGFGYLDAWHLVGTLFLLPLFVLGLARNRRELREPGWQSVLRPAVRAPLRTRYGAGRALMLATAVGMLAGGGAILVLGMTTVFVPQDLAFMHAARAALMQASPRLVPLIAHDRTGFGGALVSCAVAVAACAWCGTPSRSLWQALVTAGVFGFGCAIGVHFVVGYVDAVHLGPATAGALLFAAAAAVLRRPMLEGVLDATSPAPADELLAAPPAI